jgi:hypothetical protein
LADSPVEAPLPIALVVMPNCKTNMKSLFIIFFFLVLFFHLDGQKHIKVIGLYGKCPKSYLACEQIQFNRDSTFKYAIFYDVGGLNTWEGTWSTKTDTIIINSYLQPKTEEEKKIANESYHFYQSGFITNLKFILKGNKLFTTDFETKNISNTDYLRKTKSRRKIF